MAKSLKKRYRKSRRSKRIYSKHSKHNKHNKHKKHNKHSKHKKHNKHNKQSKHKKPKNRISRRKKSRRKNRKKKQNSVDIAGAIGKLDFVDMVEININDNRHLGKWVFEHKNEYPINIEEKKEDIIKKIAEVEDKIKEIVKEDKYSDKEWEKLYKQYLPTTTTTRIKKQYGGADCDKPSKRDHLLILEKIINFIDEKWDSNITSIEDITKLFNPSPGYISILSRTGLFNLDSLIGLESILSDDIKSYISWPEHNIQNTWIRLIYLYSLDKNDTQASWTFSDRGETGLFNMCPKKSREPYTIPYYKCVNNLLLGILKPNEETLDLILSSLYNCIYYTIYGLFFNPLTFSDRNLLKKNYVFRGENNDWNNVREFGSGDTLVSSSFLSTTHVRQMAINFTNARYSGPADTQHKIIYIINISKIERYLYISNYSRFKTEYEWLLPPFTTLQITEPFCDPEILQFPSDITLIYCIAELSSMSKSSNRESFKVNLKNRIRTTLRIKQSELM